MAHLLLRGGFEAFLLIGLLYVFFIKFKVLHALRDLGAIRMGVFLVFFGFWMIVQLIDRWQYKFPDKKVEFFPIARFAMFEEGGITTETFVYNFTGRFSNGATENYILANLFNGTANSTLSTKFNSIIISSLKSKDEKRQDWAKKEIVKYIKSIYNVLNFKEKELPDSIEFEIVHIDLTKTTSNAITKEKILSIKNPFAR